MRNSPDPRVQLSERPKLMLCYTYLNFKNERQLVIFFLFYYTTCLIPKYWLSFVFISILSPFIRYMVQFLRYAKEHNYLKCC